MTAAGYHPNCCRTILLDVQPMFYPIGNTRAASVYQSPLGEDQFRALFLGCGDPRNAIATAAEAGKDDKLKLLQLSLNDRTAPIISRAGLLLLMASELDPESKEDMALLWAVWYCLDLFPEQAKRLSGFLKRLLKGESGDRLYIEVKEGLQEVRKVWQAWASAATDGSFPSASEARKRRKKWIGGCPSSGSTEVVGFKQKIDACTIYETTRVKPFMEPTEGYERVRREIKGWFETGSSHLRTTSGVAMVANPTLLQPGTWAWQVHYGSCPFSSFYPLGFEEDLPQLLLQTCTNKFTDMVRGFARCCKRVQVEVKLWAMDALAMCDHGLSDIACFDAIDTSNLADNVELLNLILMAVPRLETHPSARLYTQTMVWPNSVQSYLDNSLGLPIKIYPALLGVRLLTDLRRGTLPFTHHDRLEWAVVPSRTHIPQALGDKVSDVMEGLRALAKRCCQHRTKDSSMHIVNQTIALTPLSLALAVVSAASRVLGIVDLALSWSQNASALFSALALAENQRAEWDTWMCWLLADKLPGKDETTTSGELAVFQGRLKPVDYQKVMDKWKQSGYRGITTDVTLATPAGLVGMGVPMLRMALIDQAQLMAAFMAGNVGPDINNCAQQTLNCVGYDLPTYEATFVLHSSHADKSRSSIMLHSAVNGTPFSVNDQITNMTRSRFTARPPPIGRVKLAEPWDSTSNSDGLRLMSVTERNTSYLITVGFSPSTKVSFVEVRLAFLGTSVFTLQSATLASINCDAGVPVECAFACPVTEQGQKIQVSRKRRLLLIELHKCALWPEDEFRMPRLDIDTLPPLCDESTLRVHMTNMFMYVDTATLADVTKMVDKMVEYQRSGHGWPVPEDPVEAAVHDARESIQILFVSAWQKKCLLHKLDASHLPEHDSEDSIQMFLHLPIRQLPNGSPLIQVSYCDELEVVKKPSGLVDMKKALQRFSAGQKAFGIEGTNNTVKCGEGELEYFRHTLLYNSVRTAPSRQQKKVLGIPKHEWRASFLLPSYFQRHESKGQAWAPKATGGPKLPVRASSVSEDTADGVPEILTGREGKMAAMRLKDEANELFKAGKYEKAEALYQEGLKALKAGGANMGDPAIGDLQKALYLNSAAALLKQAEAVHGAPALKPPAELSRSQKADLCLATFYCQRALELEKANAKALYRQAQAYAYLGDNKSASKAVEKAKRSSEPDAAMDKLEKLLQERLQLSS